VSLHYDRNFADSTVFIAGCVQHTYIMPLDPAYRDVQSSWSNKEIRKHVSKSSGKWTNLASLGDIAYIKGSAGPFRWFTANFAGSDPKTGSRLSPAQYPDGSTLGEMVTIWANSNTADIVGMQIARFTSFVFINEMCLQVTFVQTVLSAATTAIMKLSQPRKLRSVTIFSTT
jgi:hypothetical protein